MNKENLILKLIEMLMGEQVEKETAVFEHKLKGKPVIIRARDAGVHFGYLEHFKDRVVTLKRSRRMWRWWAAKQMTLSAVAEFGLNHDKDLRINNELPLIIINDACEIIPCSDVCVKSIEKVEPYDGQ